MHVLARQQMNTPCARMSKYTGICLQQHFREPSANSSGVDLVCTASFGECMCVCLSVCDIEEHKDRAPEHIDRDYDPCDC